MIATVAFCQLSSCMNQTNNSVNGTQSSPAARPIEMWTVKLPVGFRSTFVQTNNLVAVIDFDAKKVSIPYMSNINVLCTGPEVMGRTSLSIEYSRFYTFTIPTGNSHAPLAPHPPRHFSWQCVPDGNRVVEVDLSTKQARAPSGMDLQFSVAGTVWNTSLSIVKLYTPPHTNPAGVPCALPMSLVTRSLTNEMKEEKTQEKKESQTAIEINSVSSQIPENKDKESKLPKEPKDLKEMVDSNSHTEKVDKTKANQRDKIDREYFLNKYSNEPLDSKAKELIRALFDSGIKSAANILDELLTPSNTTVRERNFYQVRNKVGLFTWCLKKGREATD